MRPLVIVNPRAGGGRAGRTFGATRPVIERALGPIDVEMTQASGHAITLARQAAEAGRRLIVALGGDGTLHEVANGILDARDQGRAEETALGFIAEGTGGDFRKSIGLPHRLDRYLEAIASGRERRVDAARATFRNADGTEGKRWFVNILSAGLGGKVDRFVADSPRGLAPTAAYFWATVRAMAVTKQAPLLCTVTHEGKRTEHKVEAWVVAVCNGTTFGSGMQIAPMAAVDDGKLEVVVLSAPSRVGLALLSRKVYAGTHIGAPGVTHLSGDRVEIAPLPEAREKVLLDVDGEPLGELPVKIEVVRGILPLRV